jgi:hypothetical protein
MPLSGPSTPPQINVFAMMDTSKQETRRANVGFATKRVSHV